MRIVVNASAAKHGGAREIIRRYAFSISQEKNADVFYLVCPGAGEFSDLPNIVPIEMSTSGIWTYLFSIIGVYFFVLKFGASKIVSFNNVNLLASLVDCVTYFHQEKIFSGKGGRFFLLRFAIKANRKQKFIVQSDRIKARLHQELGVCLSSVCVKWPGVRKVALRSKSEAFGFLKDRFPEFAQLSEDAIFVIFPIYSSRSEHKDYAFLEAVKSRLGRLEVLTISLCPSDSEVADINLNRVEPAVMDALYSISSGMVVSSKHETLCLPLFEYIQTGRKIICRSAPFVNDFKARHPLWLKSVSIFPPDEAFEWLGDGFFVQPTADSQVSKDLLAGDWDI